MSIKQDFLQYGSGQEGNCPMEQELYRDLKEFNHIYRGMNELYHEIARELKLSDSAFDVLYAMCILGDGCLQRDVCSMSAISKQTVHCSVRQLERDGLLRFEPCRGREVHMYLTEAGRRLAGEKIGPVIQAECAAFGAMEPEARRTFLQLNGAYLLQLRRSVERLIHPEAPDHTKPDGRTP